MGWFSGIGSAVSGAVSSVKKHATALADPRRVLASVDPRQLKKRMTSTGRLFGSSMVPGAGSLMQGAAVTLKDRIRMAAGDPRSIAKGIMSVAASSQSSRWAPAGLGRGLGPIVSNIASAKRDANALKLVQHGNVKLARWF